MTADEVRMLDNRMAIAFIRGEYPVTDEKYDIHSHPNISKTSDGGAEPYLHGKAPWGGMELVPLSSEAFSSEEIKAFEELKGYATSYELYDETEAESLTEPFKNDTESEKKDEIKTIPKGLS